jgi:hypothetical protein
MEKEEKSLREDEPIPESSRPRLMEVSILPGKREVFIRYALMERTNP